MGIIQRIVIKLCYLIGVIKMAEETPTSTEEIPTSTEETPISTEETPISAEETPARVEEESNGTEGLKEENSRLSDVISELKEELAGARKMKSALAEIINPAVKESITKLVEEFVRNKK